MDKKRSLLGGPMGSLYDLAMNARRVQERIDEMGYGNSEQLVIEVPSEPLRHMLQAAADLEQWGKTVKLVLTLGRDGKLKTIAIDTEEP